MPVVASVKSIAAAQRSLRFAWPSIKLAKKGDSASSKSAMKTFAPELSALTIILRSTGPVISTRRSSRSAGIRRDLPIGFPNGAGFGQKIRRLARVEQLLPLGAARERRQPPGVEAAMQLSEEGQGVGGQDFVVTRPRGCAKLDVVEFRLGVHIGLPVGRGRAKAT